MIGMPPRKALRTASRLSESQTLFGMEYLHVSQTLFLVAEAILYPIKATRTGQQPGRHHFRAAEWQRTATNRAGRPVLLSNTFSVPAIGGIDRWIGTLA